MESFSPFENPNLIAAPREKLVVERRRSEEEVQIISPPPPKKTQKNPKLKEIKDDDDDNKRNWLDSEVETLIALKGEMQPEFVKNAKKQGVDMWLKLHSRLLCLCPNFRKTPKACKSKFNDLFKAYKDDKQANSISGEVRHTCKFYDAMDTWYHQNGAVMKHIYASSNDNVDMGCGSQDTNKEESEETSKSSSTTRKMSGKMIYQEKALDLISQLVVNSQDMARSMQIAYGFMSNLDKHIEKLIEKL